MIGLLSHIPAFLFGLLSQNTAATFFLSPVLSGFFFQFEKVECGVHVFIAECIDVGGAGSSPIEPAGRL